jgi:hypothetical protein
MQSKPQLEPNDSVTDRSVRRGKQTRTKKAVAAKVEKQKKAAKRVAMSNAAAMESTEN